MRRPSFAILCALAAAITGLATAATHQSQAPAPSHQPPRSAERQTAQVAPGVAYTHIRRTAADGLPLSIHVLEVARREKSLKVEAARATSQQEEMRRELPTAMALREAAAGARVLAVVNGDYDLGAPYLGVSDGLEVVKGTLGTTGKPDWPALVFLRSGEPVIAVPHVMMELRSGKHRWAVAGLNKPLGAAHGAGPRLWTSAFRKKVKSDRPFRAVVITRLSHALPLHADDRVRGVVSEVKGPAKELEIPADSLVLAERAGGRPAGPEGYEATSPGARPLEENTAAVASSIAALRAGDRVELRISVQIGGKRGVAHAIGGFPILVQAGRRAVLGTPSQYLAQRHPRTAACYNREKLIFAVVDGRQPQLSMGMTLEELADLMVELGCETAMNTDGGGSSVMAVNVPVPQLKPETFKDKAYIDLGATELKVKAATAAGLAIMNSPSDGHERGRGNAWLILGRPNAQ